MVLFRVILLILVTISFSPASFAYKGKKAISDETVPGDLNEPPHKKAASEDDGEPAPMEIEDDDAEEPHQNQDEANNSSPFDRVNHDVKDYILKFLDSRSLTQLAGTNREWQQRALSEELNRLNQSRNSNARMIFWNKIVRLRNIETIRKFFKKYDLGEFASDALAKADIEVIKMLLVADSEGEFRYALLEKAIKKANASMLETLLGLIPGATRLTDRFGNTLLHDAMIIRPHFGRHADKIDEAGTINALLKADPLLIYAKNKYGGQTPLHSALSVYSWNPNLRTIQALVNANPEAIEAVDDLGNTPLHTAAEHGSTDALKVLLAASREGSTRIRNCGGQTPLHLAAGKGHTDAVEILLNADFESLRITDSEGDLPIHHAAARSEGKKAMEVLKKADPDSAKVSNKKGLTASDLVLDLEKMLVRRHEIRKLQADWW